MNIIGILKEAGIAGLIDIAFMALIVYAMIVFFKRTKAAFILIGIMIISFIYILARQFGLILTASVLQQFFAVILIVVVVIFQEELRRFFEQVAVWSLIDRSNKVKRLTRKDVEIILRTSVELAKDRVGGIIVISGKDPIHRHLQGGISLNGELSDTMLKSIFDVHSPGHDGAIVIEKNKITQFACQLPLSKSFHKIQGKGTRHAAGLGLAELTDALCIVISEERGTISLAHNGDIYQVNDPEKLKVELEKFFLEISPVSVSRPWYDFYRHNSLEKIVAILMSVTMWFVLVHESRLVNKSFTVPVEHGELAADLALKDISPKEVTITLSGPRRRFYFFKKEEVKLFIQLYNAKEGVNYIQISNSDLSIPSDLTYVTSEPHRVRAVIQQNINKPQ